MTQKSTVRSLYSRFRTDPAKETKGVAKDYGTCVLTLKRAGSSNEAFHAAYATAFAPYQQVMARRDAGSKGARASLRSVRAAHHRSVAVPRSGNGNPDRRHGLRRQRQHGRGYSGQHGRCVDGQLSRLLHPGAQRRDGPGELPAGAAKRSCKNLKAVLGYTLKYGRHERDIAHDWALGLYGMPEPPDLLQKAPQLWPHLQVYLDAFWDLYGDRGGMGDGPILWSAAHSWACCHGMEQAQFCDLWYFLREMDRVFLAHLAAKK